MLWLQKKISRTEYVALASKNKSATKSFKIRPTQTICAPVLASFAKSTKAAVTNKRKEKIPKPHEENENPQWILTGPEYSSDYAGDGPHSSEEYDPEKDRATNRKRKQAKARKRWKRKRKQRDSEYRSNEFNTRTKKRQTGVEVRNHSGDVRKKQQ